MSFNIEWTNADALTPSPITVIKDGNHFEFKVDAHYVSDEEVETVRRYVAALKDENDRLRELLVGAFEDMNAWQRIIAGSNEWGYGKGCLDRLCKLRDAMQELGMEVVV